MFDVIIAIAPKRGRKQPMRITFTESGLKKLAHHSPAFLEGLQVIENELAKELFPNKSALACAEISFEADDPDLADCEARDIAELFLKRMRLHACIQNESGEPLLI